MVDVERGGIGRGKIISKEHRLAVDGGQTRFFLTPQLRNHAIADVLQIRGALGHDPACGVKHSHELGRGLYHGIGSVRARSDILTHRLAPSAVTHHARRGGQHLGGGAFGVFGAPIKALGYRIRGAHEPLIFTIAVLLRNGVAAGGKFGARANPNNVRIGDARDHTGPLGDEVVRSVISRTFGHAPHSSRENAHHATATCPNTRISHPNKHLIS